MSLRIRASGGLRRGWPFFCVAALSAPAVAQTPIRALDVSFDGAVALGGLTATAPDVVRLSEPPALVGGGALPPGTNLVGYHRRLDGTSLRAYDVPVHLGDAFARPFDVVRHDEQSDTYSIWFSGEDAGLPHGVGVDAIGEDATGALLLSFTVTVDLGDFVAADEDLVRYLVDGAPAEGSFAPFFVGADAGVHPGLDLDAAHLLPNGNLLLSFDGSGVAGRVYFTGGDLLEHDLSAGTWTLAFAGSAAGLATADVDAVFAVAAVEGGGPADADGDGVADDLDNCPGVPDPRQTDGDGDGLGDACDLCPEDPAKSEPGQCGCGDAEADADGDRTADCRDFCPGDAHKSEPGACGCDVPDADGDGDGTPDCLDACPENPAKVEPGPCGCGWAEDDWDGDGTFDCDDVCPFDPLKAHPGVCGCHRLDEDRNGDGAPDCGADCREDADGDGVCDDADLCRDIADPAQEDLDGDGAGDACDEDDDGDGVFDPLDNCPIHANADQRDTDRDGAGDACDTHFEAGNLADLVEAVGTEMVATLAGIDRLPGANGLIAKVHEVVTAVNAAAAAFGAGELAPAAYAEALAAALAELGAFENQLRAKTSLKKPQIPAAEARALEALSMELRGLLHLLIEHAF